MNYRFTVVCGFAGSVLSWLFGGWDTALQTLFLFMAADYLSGLVVAGIFRKSAKTKTGGLSSSVGFQGLMKKGMILLLVMLSHHLDVVMGMTCIRDGVCVAFMANELLSIIENAGIMGVPVPKIIRNAIDLLKQKGDKND